MHPGKRDAAAGRPGSSLLVQASLAGLLVLLAFVWSTTKTPGPPQQLQQLVTGLSLNVEVGTVPRQNEADEWCAARPAPSFPPSDNQLRQLRIAIVVDPVCRRQEYFHPDKMADCLDAITGRCKDLTKNGCFGGWASKVPECADFLPLEVMPDGSPPGIKWSHYQNWWMTVMTLVAPELRARGWDNLKILSDSKSASERRMASCADVIITSTIMFWQLYPIKHNMRPRQKVIIVEQYGAGTFMIPDDLEQAVESSRTLAVVKHVIALPPERQNGPYLEERAHLAYMAPHIEGSDQYLTVKERPWSSQALNKMYALLPMTVRFAHPLHCGGSWSFIRYHGFFTKNHTAWPLPPLAERKYDVTFIGKLEYEAKAGVSGVTAHRMAAVKALTAFRDKWGEQYKVYVPQGERLEYHEYIGLLKQSKIVISPWGWGEWSHKDFEILMAGCVVVKPRADIFRLHPNIFEHNVTAISVREDFSDLEEALLPLLQDLPRAQAMATRQQGVWRKHAKPEVLAKDWDAFLLERLRDAYSSEPGEGWQPQGALEQEAAAALSSADEQRHKAAQDKEDAAQAAAQQHEPDARQVAKDAAEEEEERQLKQGRHDQQRQEGAADEADVVADDTGEAVSEGEQQDGGSDLRTAAGQAAGEKQQGDRKEGDGSAEPAADEHSSR